MTKTVLIGLVVACLACGVQLKAAAPDDFADHPQYSAKNELIRPASYRDWMFLSSGFGMTYNPAAGGHDMFTNVFVPQWAYQEFLKSGKWPDKTMFVVEERAAGSRASINQHGHYQTTDLMGIGVEVKDASHFPEKWAYFSFDGDTKSAAANPKEGCFQCHDAHAAVEHTFVQFYPTLKPVAQRFGAYNLDREKVQTAK
ncbi:MAG TPA: cytochrome P460 family protein [Terriglobales bacterium]|nr:cytochrome P460 family protein [Terriglobales bacterium]